TVSICTTITFAHASSPLEIAVARVAGGAGDAVVFSSLMKLVGVRFAPERFAFMAGASQVAGYLGGLLATAPLAIGVQLLGWRGSFFVVALVLSAILLIAIGLLKDESLPVERASSLRRMLNTTALLLRKPSTWGPVV